MDNRKIGDCEKCKKNSFCGLKKGLLCVEFEPCPYKPSNKEKLISIRKKLELTQVEMAKAMGYSLSGYCKLEQGQRMVKDRHIQAAENLEKA